MIRPFVFIFLISFALVGCASPATQTPATQQSLIPSDRILVQLDPLACACGLGDVDYALMKLEGVTSVNWEFENNRFFLMFLDDRRPSDRDIREALSTTSAVIREIRRP